jgi:hypothetical protein
VLVCVSLCVCACVRAGVQAYLRGRADTVRCIVMGLTDDTDSELFNELRAAAADTPRPASPAPSSRGGGARRC